ncbi:hypothetical protein J4E81_003123 [Alternaria sp. BMP 2799]|nr:hypothetical protein J4E81_003123 [Alternaria sp. BMP 2799]
MPPYRTPKKAWGNSSNPNKNSFVPAKETLDNEANEEYRNRAVNDPYTHYILKTGKHRGKTLKQVHEEGRNEGYLNWMLRTPKACKDLDGEHVVKKGLLYWKEHASSAEPVKTPTKPSSRRDSVASETGTSRFKDTQGKQITISGGDVAGLFHMRENQLKTAGVKRKSNYVMYSKRYWSNVYSLKDVYDAAVRTPNCPRDETPDQALELYFEKVKRCGHGTMFFMPECCECFECENLRAGPTQGGLRFVSELQMERLKQMQKEQEREDRRWIGIEPWMGDYD